MKLKVRRNLLVIRKNIYYFFMILLGAAIMAFGTSQFLLPNQLSTGGFSGIGTIFYYLFHFPMGSTILVLNIPFFLLAIYKMGKEFFVRSLIGTIAFSVFLDIFDQYEAFTQDRFLSCIYGGVLMGLGTAIVLKYNASTGGTDLITNIIHEYNSRIQMSSVMTMIDIGIVGLNILFFREIEIGLYSAIAIYLMGKMIDVVFEGVYFTKLLFIISDRNKEIAERIGIEAKKGTTGLYGKGMYTNEETLVLLCAAARGDVARVKEIALETDPNAFIVIANSREVLGTGFKKIKVKKG